MSRARLGPPGHKSDLYTNMSALVAAKSPGFKSEIRLASIASGWSGRRGRSFVQTSTERREFSSLCGSSPCGYAEIFKAIHFRCLHYVALAYRPFEWRFYRSGNYSRGALPDGSNFFPQPRTFLRKNTEERSDARSTTEGRFWRRDYGCTFATSYMRSCAIGVPHIQYNE